MPIDKLAYTLKVECGHLKLRVDCESIHHLP